MSQTKVWTPKSISLTLQDSRFIMSSLSYYAIIHCLNNARAHGFYPVGRTRPLCYCRLYLFGSFIFGNFIIFIALFNFGATLTLCQRSFLLVQESGSFHTTQKSKKSDFLKKSDFSMVWILLLSCTRFLKPVTRCSSFWKFAL